MSLLEEVQRRVEGHKVVRHVDKVPKGHVRLETAFKYPDGSSIDVFLVEAHDLYRSRKLTDLGSTIEWLLDLQVKPSLSKKRQAFLENALNAYGVNQEGGALELPIENLDTLVDDVIVLGQACIRVADLTYTRRASLQVPVADEVEEILVDADVTYEQNAALVGRHRELVPVDFLTHGRRLDSAILTLASGNPTHAHVKANEIFRRWYDLDTPEREEQRITVYDDRYDTYRADDLERLEDFSHVVALSDRQTFADLVAA
jgi:hypothetical protein